MATTGLWPVKNRLKEVIDYAENPDKTIEKKYVDSDLYAALQYVSNDKKTDKSMYVSGINCNAKRAYERMMATKKRFGKVGGNVAYHGYQSFQSGEVTPEEAHKIGMETARRMWGKDYEIIVTTHLNTDNIHNHFVVNSVSFKTAKKFENHISDHYKLREISDTVCLEYGKSVLKDAAFYNGEKKDYWLKKKSNMTHRELLKSDIDSAVAQSTNFKAFEIRLKDMGYEICRDEHFSHYSVKAPGWQRAILLVNMQEPIISEELWLRVQELRQHRRRPTATGRTSLFSGLVFCPDCGAKLHFAAAKSMTRNQEHFRCSNYKSGRGTCTVHYIRDVVLERLVLEAISELADFVKCHETVFLYMLARKTNAMRQKEYKRLQKSVEYGKKRIAEIDRLMKKAFEKNVIGILSDEALTKMLQDYETEQKALTQEVIDSQQTLENANQKVTDLRLLLRTLREMMEIKELTPTLVNSFIERIEKSTTTTSQEVIVMKKWIFTLQQLE